MIILSFSTLIYKSDLVGGSNAARGQTNVFHSGSGY